jgi:hypothetical protein
VYWGVTSCIVMCGYPQNHLILSQAVTLVYSKTLISCSQILCFLEFSTLFVSSWPNAHKYNVSWILQFPTSFATIRWSPQNVKLGFYCILMTLWLSIYVFVPFSTYIYVCQMSVRPRNRCICLIWRKTWINVQDLWDVTGFPSKMTNWLLSLGNLCLRYGELLEFVLHKAWKGTFEVHFQCSWIYVWI